MKILLLSYEYPPETGFGGIGTYTWHQARALARLGHEVHVFAGSVDATPLRATFRHGITIWRLQETTPPIRIARALGRTGLRWSRSRLEVALQARRALAQLDREIGFDVIEGPECGADGLFAASVTNARVFVRLQSPARLIGEFYDLPAADLHVCSALERACIRRAHGIISSSAFVANEVRRVYGESRPITVIPNGIDLQWFDSTRQIDATRVFHLPRGRPRILFGSRLERRKGVHLFRDMVLGVLERHDVAFIFAGRDDRGYMQSTLLPEIRARARRGSVHYLGHLGLNEIRSCLRQSDVFLFPSLWDSCPSAILEAMAAGRAIVASDAGGIPELVTANENGLIAGKEDIPAFVDALSELIEGASLRDRLGSAARRTVETRFTDTLVAQRSVAEYGKHLALAS